MPRRRAPPRHNRSRSRSRSDDEDDSLSRSHSRSPSSRSSSPESRSLGTRSSRTGAHSPNTGTKSMRSESPLSKTRTSTTRSPSPRSRDRRASNRPGKRARSPSPVKNSADSRKQRKRGSIEVKTSGSPHGRKERGKQASSRQSRTYREDQFADSDDDEHEREKEDNPLMSRELEVLSEEEKLKRLMGFSDFSTTKGQPIPDNIQGAGRGAVNKTKKRKYRQYMNRVGGFNKLLDTTD